MADCFVAADFFVATGCTGGYYDDAPAGLAIFRNLHRQPINEKFKIIPSPILLWFIGLRTALLHFLLNFFFFLL